MASHGPINCCTGSVQETRCFIWNTNRWLAPRKSHDLTGQHSVALRYHTSVLKTFSYLAPSQLLTRPVVSGEAPGIRYLLYLHREARLLKAAAFLHNSWLSPEHEQLAHAQLRSFYPLSTKCMSLTVIHMISRTKLSPFICTIFNESKVE